VLIIVFWLGLAVAVGAIAVGRDRSGIGWFLLAVIISPLIAGIFLLIVGEGGTDRCPFCAEKVKSKARICPHCRSDIIPGEIKIEGQEPESKWKSGSAIK
jgi:hypothetical protein